MKQTKPNQREKPVLENCPANHYDIAFEEYRCHIDNRRCSYHDNIRACDVYQRFVMPRRCLR